MTTLVLSYCLTEMEYKKNDFDITYVNILIFKNLIPLFRNIDVVQEPFIKDGVR